MASGQCTPVFASIQRLLTDGTMTGLSEGQLLERFLARGDEAAFEAIVRRHGPMVLGVCRRVLSDPNDVEDAFQATFLVLVRKAGSIRDRDVLGTWLYGVARRVAVRARVDARRRRARQWSDATEPACEDRRGEGEDGAEFRAIIDEEISRLTERYRSPLVLCDLEGHTHEQAAVQLRCPVGTVKSRLARAREKLRSRLARRGLAPSAGLLAAALAPEPASAMTTELLGSTIGAATRVAAGRAIAAGAVSAAVAALVEGTMRSTSMTALKFAATLLTAAGIIATGAGVLAYQVPGNQPAGAAIDPRTKVVLEPKGIPEPQTKAFTEEFKVALPKPAVADTKKAQGTDPSQTIASLAQARHWSAVVSFEKALSDYQAGRITIDALRDKALRVLEAHRDLINTKDSRIADLENYLGVIRKAWERAKSENNHDELVNAEYYRLEAELWLAQAKAGREPSLPGPNPGGRPGTGPSGRPGSDPRSQALLVRLEEPIPMSFPNPTPLEDVLKYIQQATAGPNGEGIPIYVNPVGLEPGEDEKLRYEKLMKTPIAMDLVGVPLRRTLKLIADQLEMGYGIKDGMVMFTWPDMRWRNWHELLVMEESFPQSSPLDLEIERARRGELTPSELDQLNERLKAIEEVTKRAQSIRMMRFTPGPMFGGMMRGMPSPVAGPQAKPQ
jgi:RNA polymerase sigma factor (sigma-70 family)